MSYIITGTLISSRLETGKKKAIEPYLVLMPSKINHWGIAYYKTDKEGKQTETIEWVELTAENLMAEGFTNPRLKYADFNRHFNQLLSQADGNDAKYTLEHLTSFFTPEILVHFSVQVKGIDLNQVSETQMKDIQDQLGLSVEAKALKTLNMMSESTISALGGKLPAINPPLKTVQEVKEPSEEEPKNNNENKPPKK